MESQRDSKREPTTAEIRTIIAASAAGTAFEWYDFYIYGTLAPLFGKLFFPGSSPAAGFLLALATFGVGFAVRGPSARQSLARSETVSGARSRSSSPSC